MCVGFRDGHDGRPGNVWVRLANRTVRRGDEGGQALSAAYDCRHGCLSSCTHSNTAAPGCPSVPNPTATHTHHNYTRQGRTPAWPSHTGSCCQSTAPSCSGSLVHPGRVSAPRTPRRTRHGVRTWKLVPTAGRARTVLLAQLALHDTVAVCSGARPVMVARHELPRLRTQPLAHPHLPSRHTPTYQRLVERFGLKADRHTQTHTPSRKPSTQQPAHPRTTHFNELLHVLNTVHATRAFGLGGRNRE